MPKLRVILLRSLLAALAGALLYSLAAEILVRGERATAIQGHFRWPDFETCFGLTLLMTPFALPTAIVVSISHFLIERFKRRAAIMAFMACAAVVLPVVVYSFPIYMKLLDTSNDWERGILLPACVYFSGALMHVLRMRGAWRQQRMWA